MVKDIDLAIREGEFLVILGPSGSGKTTILRLLAGLIAPGSGDIRLRGASILSVPVERRPFNTVFQDYALFPHMTVAENVGFGLSVRGKPKREIAAQTVEVLELVALSDFAGRFPAQLSGGQQQRVALARAIICEPAVILLDEPFAALDVELRRQMQASLKDIQRRIATTFVLITHDQAEAIALADRICVIDQGRILQLDAPETLYARPANLRVAQFFGENNLIAGRVVTQAGAVAEVETAMGTLRAGCGGTPQSGDCHLALRPEAISFAPPGQGFVSGKVDAKDFAGAVCDIRFRPDRGPDLHIKGLSAQPLPQVGQATDVRWAEDALWLVPG